MSYRIPIDREKLDQAVKELRPFTVGFDALPDHLVITDVNGNVLYANEAALAKTGFGRDEIIGHNPGDLWGGLMPKKIYEEMWQTVKVERKPWLGSVKNHRKDGSFYHQELMVNAIIGDHNELLYFIGIEPQIRKHHPVSESEAKGKLAAIEDFIKFLGSEELHLSEIPVRLARLKANAGDWLQD